MNTSNALLLYSVATGVFLLSPGPSTSSLVPFWHNIKLATSLPSLSCKKFDLASHSACFVRPNNPIQFVHLSNVIWHENDKQNPESISHGFGTPEVSSHETLGRESAPLDVRSTLLND